DPETNTERCAIRLLDLGEHLIDLGVPIDFDAVDMIASEILDEEFVARLRDLELAAGAVLAREIRGVRPLDDRVVDDVRLAPVVPERGLDQRIPVRRPDVSQRPIGPINERRSRRIPTGRDRYPALRRWWERRGACRSSLGVGLGRPRT